MKKIAVGIAFLITIILILISIFSQWFIDRMIQDFWPIDNSRVGPNLVASVAQWIIVVLIASIFYPPLRKWIEKEINIIHQKLDNNELLSKHIIKHHPDIPNMKETKEK